MLREVTRLTKGNFTKVINPLVNPYIACDKDGTLHTHQTKPIRAQYGRSVKDTFWESGTKQQATEELRKTYSFMRWEHEPIELKGRK